jgi:hypothetical protein
MSRDPLTGISFREYAKTDSKPFIDVAQPLLRNAVDFADRTFWRCRAVALRPDREDFPPLALYRHIIEMTDGIAFLISEGASGPCAPILRSSFEAWLNLTYIMKKETEYRQRSLAWLCAFIHSEIEQKEMLDPATSRGGMFKKRLKAEAPKVLEKLGPVDKLEPLQQLLKQPDLTPFEAEFQRLTQEKSGDPPYWCSLVSGGPTSLQKLADRLGRGASHRVFYGSWSKLIHGVDATRFLTERPDGTAQFNRLRDPELRMKLYAWHALWLINVATKLMLKKFIPGEDFSERENYVMKGLDRLDSFKLKTKWPDDQPIKS